MYFEVVPNIAYDEKPIKYPFSESDRVVAKNFFRRYKLNNDVFSYVVFFNKYAIKDGERPDMLAKKIYGEDYEGKEDVHWSIYWEYDDGSQWKEWAIKNRINQVESIIEETGREAYRLYILGDQGHFTELNRHKLFPVMTVGN